MSEAKLIKFRHENHKGVFTYTVLDGDFVSLSEKTAGKIRYIKEKGAIDLSFDLKSETYDVMAVDVIEDPAYVQKVYDHFIASGTAYFKNGIDGLCVLKFHK